MLVGVFGVWSYTSFEVTLMHTPRAHLAPMMCPWAGDLLAPFRGCGNGTHVD